MKMLKAVVIATAILIVVGVGVLIWGVTHHWNDSIGRLAPAAVSTNSGADAGGASAVVTSAEGSIVAEIAAPDGMRFDQMTATADRLLLRFVGPQGDRILVVDPKSGRVTGTISIAPNLK